MSVSAGFHCDEKTTLSIYLPTNNSITLACNRFQYDHLTLYNLPEPIVRAFLDHYGDPNVKAEVEEPATEQV